MIRFPALLAPLCVCLTLGTAIAYAQVNPFRSSRIGSGLDQEDLRLMSEASAQLYNQQNPSPGTTTDWSNPKSGDSGKITLMENLTKSGMQCRRMKYDIRLQKRTGPRVYTVDWCKTKSGAWKLA